MEKSNRISIQKIANGYLLENFDDIIFKETKDEILKDIKRILR